MNGFTNARSQFKSIARNEQRRIWNAKLAEAGYNARYITEAEEITEVEEIQEVEEIVEVEAEKTVEEIAEEIYEAVVEYDTELGTENFLPIYHVRHALPYKRKQFDTALYTLIASDRIEYHTLQEVGDYEPKQIDAGIPQQAGGPLFFLSVI
jgi:hypothetical protein